MGNWSSNLPVGDLAGGLDDRLGDVGLELAEIAIGHGRGDLDQAQGVDQPRRQRLAGDREILHGPLRLGPVIGLGGDLDVAHRIFFHAKFTHG